MIIQKIDDYEKIASTFHQDGYLVLSQIFSPSFTANLLQKSLTTFHAVLNFLCQQGDIEFAAPSRLSSDGLLQYPLGQGLKCGYKELVMRSPGRYELALLTNDSDGKGKVIEAESLCDLKTVPSKVEFSEHTDTTICQENRSSKSPKTLELLVEWIQNFINHGSIESNQLGTQQNEAYAQDHHQLQKLLELVNEILSESETGSSNNNNNNNTRSSFHLVNFSLVISTPGSETQSWHADGGHVSLTEHAPCHCFNVFIPLIDVPISLGPTELRPSSHYYTRDLTKMMLGAMARKELRPTVTPELKRGDALIFDYRILHRGRANLSHLGDDVEIKNGDGREENEKERVDRNHGGRDRPILVMTFAKSWFVDVCNFPKRSIFGIIKTD